jgi:hypothetical protein
MTGIDDVQRNGVALRAGEGIGQNATFQMNGMSSDRELVRRGLASKAERRSTGLIVDSTVAFYADFRTGPMTGVAGRRIPPQGIRQAINM